MGKSKNDDNKDADREAREAAAWYDAWDPKYRPDNYPKPPGR